MIAVVTGDFVGSKRMKPDDRKRLPILINEAIDAFADEEQKIEIFRGDSFQLRLEKIETALPLALGIRLYLKSTNMALRGVQLDVRIAIGIGNESLRRVSIGKSDGLAYQLSGEGLDHMEAHQRLAIFTEKGNIALLSSLIAFIDNWLTRLSATQAQVCLAALLGKKQADVAAQLEISQAAVNQRLKSANWSLIEKALQELNPLFSAH